MARPKKISMGLAGMTWYFGFCPLLNWYKIGDSPEVGSSTLGTLKGEAIWNAGGYLNPANGEIINPAPADMDTLLKVFCGSSGIYEGEEFTIEWDGSATLIIQGLGVGSSTASINSNKSTCTFGSGVAIAYVVFTLTNRNDPPRNIRCYQSRYASAVTAGKKFNPDWMAEMRNFESFRFMDWAATNWSAVENFNQLADFTCSSMGNDFFNTFPHGPKGGINPSVVCAFVEEHGSVKNVHVCFPHRFTDAAVLEYVQYFRDDSRMADCVVTYEYSNECWNFQFGQAHYTNDQGQLVWPGEGQAYKRWYGLRSAQIMKIVYDAYGPSNRARWRGCLGLHNGFYNVAANNFFGIEYFLSDELSPPNSMVVSDLFDEASGTCYFGDGINGNVVMDITKANPAVVNFGATAHGYANGDLVKIYAPQMTQIDGTYGTVANKTDYTFELSGVNSSAYTDFAKITVAGKFVTAVTKGAVTTTMTSTAHGLSTGTQTIVATLTGWETMAGSYTVTVVDANTLSIAFDSSGFPAFNLGVNYVTAGPLFKWMDESTAANISNPGTYPTKYTLFDTLLSESLLNGTATSPGGFTHASYTNIMSGSVGSLKTAWTFLKNLCTTHGIAFGMYEGGLHHIPAGPLATSGGNAQFKEFNLAFGHSAKAAELYTASYKLFYRISGERASKFVEAAEDGLFGTWGGVRQWPLVSNGNTDDTGNAVWQAVKSFNITPVPETYTIGFV